MIVSVNVYFVYWINNDRVESKDEKQTALVVDDKVEGNGEKQTVFMVV